MIRDVISVWVVTGAKHVRMSRGKLTSYVNKFGRNGARGNCYLAPETLGSFSEWSNISQFHNSVAHDNLLIPEEGYQRMGIQAIGNIYMLIGYLKHSASWRFRV